MYFKRIKLINIICVKFNKTLNLNITLNFANNLLDS
jgi:hypothetical protein